MQLFSHRQCDVLQYIRVGTNNGSSREKSSKGYLYFTFYISISHHIISVLDRYPVLLLLYFCLHQTLSTRLLPHQMIASNYCTSGCYYFVLRYWGGGDQCNQQLKHSFQAAFRAVPLLVYCSLSQQLSTHVKTHFHCLMETIHPHLAKSPCQLHPANASSLRRHKTIPTSSGTAHHVPVQDPLPCL